MKKLKDGDLLSSLLIHAIMFLVFIYYSDSIKHFMKLHMIPVKH